MRGRSVACSTRFYLSQEDKAALIAFLKTL
jgi:hypothetical protein